MKQRMFAALMAFLPFLASAQMMPDSTVQVCAYWNKGDRAVYECKSTTVKIEQDGTETTSNAASETRIFEVIDETEKSYIINLKSPPCGSFIHVYCAIFITSSSVNLPENTISVSSSLSSICMTTADCCLAI